MQKHEFEERIESTVSDEDYKLIALMTDVELPTQDTGMEESEVQ